MQFQSQALAWSPRVQGGCLGSLESGFLAREWAATLANAGKALPSPTEGWTVLGPSFLQPQVTFHQAAGGSLATVVDRRHCPWALLIIWKWRSLGAPVQTRDGASAPPAPTPCPAPASDSAPAAPEPVHQVAANLARPGLGVWPPPPAPNWLICRCVNKGAAPPPV